MSSRGTRLSRGWLRACAALVVGGIFATFPAPSAHAAPPSNDEVANAVSVSGVPFSETRDTSEATFAEGDSGCGAATVWYAFTPDTNAAYLFETRGSDYDTTLAVFEGSPGDGNLLACNDDYFDLQSAIWLELTAGTTYYVEAGTCCGAEIGQVGPGGTLVFNVDLAPPAFDLELTLDPRGAIGAEPGTATVSGTITCNTEGYVYISGSLRQGQGLNIARGDFYTETACSSTPTTWAATVDAGSRVFLPKSATLNAYAYGCDRFTCDEDSASRNVKLRR
jgi:hypothetical protein